VRTSEDELSTRSASLPYYFLLALFPMFLFLGSLVVSLLPQVHSCAWALLAVWDKWGPDHGVSPTSW
jgi:uncharacterized BrkB/YihY/UPF0761 family membrane protein